MAQLRSHRDEFESLRTRVLLISFSRSEGYGRKWLQETGAPFPLLLDPERRTYRAYGLRHSVARSWSPRTLWYYVRAAFAGRKLHGIRGDPNQLGGDFIVDSDGIVRLAYRSRESVDRPPVADLLGLLRSLNREETVR